MVSDSENISGTSTPNPLIYLHICMAMGRNWFLEMVRVLISPWILHTHDRRVPEFCALIMPG